MTFFRRIALFFCSFVPFFIPCVHTVHAAASLPQTIRIGTEGAYPPMNFVDKSGNPSGFEVDLVQAICDHMHVTCLITVQDWDGLIPALLSKKIDVIASSLSATPEREKVISFSPPYFLAQPIFMVQVSNQARFQAALDKSFETDTTIGLQRGTVFSSMMMQKFPRANIELYASYDEAFLDLKTGRIDAVLGEDMVCRNFLAKTQNVQFVLVPLPKGTIASIGFGFAFRKADSPLREAFSQSLKTVKNNGRYDELLKKWNMSVNQESR